MFSRGFYHGLSDGALDSKVYLYWLFARKCVDLFLVNSQHIIRQFFKKCQYFMTKGCSAVKELAILIKKCI